MSERSPAYRLVPWTSVARPHPDVTGGALDLGTYAVNLARVFRGATGVPEVYRQPERFFAATYFTEGIRSLLWDIQTVLTGGPGNRVLQLRTPFGGGKTHSLLALLHLARDRQAAAGVPELIGLPDPGPVRVAVLSGEELDPLSPMPWPDGTHTHTLWGELGMQLGRYDLVAEHDRARSAPGGDTLRRVLGEGPVLLLLDEVLIYIEKARAIPQGESTLGRQAMLFVQALTEVANTRPQTAMVYSLQASAGEAAGAEGLLSELEHLVSRVDAKREPVSGDEVMRVVQRRLFADLGDPAVRRQVAQAYADLLHRQLRAEAETEDARREADDQARRLEERILAAYPFHPELLDLMHHRWGSLPSYQRTRGALQFLACVVHDLWQRGSDAALIGPGEVNLADEATRGAFFSQVGERESYSSVLDADIVSGGSGATVVDHRIGADAPALEQLRVGTRMATAVMLYSFGSREGEERGVLESDLVAATLVPGLDRNVIVAALHDLREEEIFLHYVGRRYRFEPVANLSKLIRDEANKLSTEEVLEAVRARLETELRESRSVVWPSEPGAVPDRVPAFQLVFLHPDWNEARQPLRSFIEQARGGPRAYRNGLALVLPDRGQLDRARAAARTRLAIQSLTSRQRFTPEQLEELQEKRTAADRDLGGAVQHAYTRAVVPVERTQQTPAHLAYELEEVDLRPLLTAGRRLADRVLEALSHRVFDEVTADRLIDLAGLGPKRPFVRCSELVDWFFSVFEFVKLKDRSPIAKAIAAGVEAGKLAYSVGLELVDDRPRLRNPNLLRREVSLDASEVDLSGDAAVLTPQLAEELVPPNPAPVEPVVLPPDPGPGPGPGPQPPEPGPHPRPGERARQVALWVRVDAAGLFGLNRALSWLREHSTTLEVEVTAHATAREEGYDPVSFRNGVEEPLVEGSAEDLKIELS
jgi:hypothetical protein